jgi:hypothetical protein
MYIRISLFLILFPVFLYGQQVGISASADRQQIKIGEEIRYRISVETDSTAQVSFPTADQFAPFEVIQEDRIDTLREHDKMRLIKEYGLTQFDTGHYVLPPLRIDVNRKEYTTDSLRFAVQNVVIDTLNNPPLYPVKSALEIKEATNKASSGWVWLLIGLLVGLALGVYWFIRRRKKRKIENPEEILPPFDRALLKLKNLKDSRYLIESNHKEYYSVLTDIIRKYLEEEIHIAATESTTDELLTKLQVFLDAGKLHLSSDVVEELRTVLRKADLVKFAKSKPEDFEAENDRKSIETIVVKTNEGLPDVSEQQEDMEDIYQRKRMETQRKKRRNRYIIIGSAASVLLLLMLWGTWYAFSLGRGENISMENWITSAYGNPPITLSTPHVLKRDEGMVGQTRFVYKEAKNPLSIMLISNDLQGYKKQEAETDQGQAENELNELAVKMIELELMKYFQGQNIMIKDDPYTTVQGVVGHKVFGSFTQHTKETRQMHYQSYFFIRESNLYMLLFAYPESDRGHCNSLVEKIMTTINIQ